MPASSRLAKQTEQFNQPPTGGFFEDEDMHTKGIMEYYTPAIGDPLHVVLPYVCWQRFRPIEKIGDIERYRAANVAAAFVFENDAIEYCAAHNGAVSPAQLEKVDRNGGAQWVRSLIDAAPETGN